MARMSRIVALFLALAATLALAGCRIVEQAVEQPVGEAPQPVGETPQPVGEAPQPEAPEAPEPEPGAEAVTGEAVEAASEGVEETVAEGATAAVSEAAEETTEAAADEVEAGVAEAAPEGEPTGEVTPEPGATEEPVEVAQAPTDATPAEGQTSAEGEDEAAAEGETPAEGDEAEAAEPEAVELDTQELVDVLQSASEQSLGAAAETASGEAEQARREAERQAAARRAELYAQGAKLHLRALKNRLRDRDLGPSLAQLTLLQFNLDGVRRNLNRQPAADDLAFALATLYSPVSAQAGNEAAVVDRAIDYLESALEQLPAPPAEAGAPAEAELPAEAEEAAEAVVDETAEAAEEATDEAEAPTEEAADVAEPLEGGELTDTTVSPAEDPVLLAQRVNQVVDLLRRGQHRTGRERLQELVLALAADDSDLLLDMAEASRRGVLNAVARQAWRTAGRMAERLDDDLQALQERIAEMAPAEPAEEEAALAEAADDALEDGAGEALDGVEAAPGSEAALVEEDEAAAPEEPSSETAPDETGVQEFGGGLDDEPAPASAAPSGG